MRVWIVCLICVALCSEEFTPWWTGSLLSNPGHTVPKGKTNIQPYLFVTDDFGVYDSKWRPHRGPSIEKANIQYQYSRGFNNWMDGKVIPQMFINWNSDHHAIRLGDLPVIFGFQLLEQQKGTWRPDIRVTLSETFPTGNYQRLNPGKKGVDISGTGSFETGIGINIQKNIHLWKNHYLRYRFNLGYTLPSPVSVEGFNTYGGGFGTDGKIYPGQVYTLILAFEFNFNQYFVFAIDLMDVYADRTKFSGKRGRDQDGNPAEIGSGSSDVLSLAPALEWNFTENLGIIGGVWFSLTGRNSEDFISYVFSVNVVY